MKFTVKYSLLLILMVHASASLFSMSEQDNFAAAIAKAAQPDFSFFDLRNIRTHLMNGANPTIPSAELNGQTPAVFLESLKGKENVGKEFYRCQALGLVKTYSNLPKK